MEKCNLTEASLLELWVIARYLAIDVGAVRRKYNNEQTEELLSLIITKSGQLKGNLPMELKDYCKHKNIDLFT